MQVLESTLEVLENFLSALKFHQHVVKNMSGALYVLRNDLQVSVVYRKQSA